MIALLMPEARRQSMGLTNRPPGGELVPERGDVDARPPPMLN